MIVPILVIGSVLAGKSALLHAHGDHGSHAHLLGSAPEPIEVVRWHESSEEHHDHSAPDKDDPDSHGTIIRFPDALPLASFSGAHSLHFVFEFWLPPVVFATLGDAPVPAIRVKGHSPPPTRAARTTIAGLLLSSHALLI